MQHAIDSPIDPARPRVDLHGLRNVPGADFATAGIGCPSCANRVRNALLAYPGIVEVEVDVSAGLMRVWHRPEQAGIRQIVSVVAVVGEASQHQYAAVPLP